MADFCMQCSLDIFGRDNKDLALTDVKEPLKEGYGYPALCEGCGPTLTDEHGVCIVNCIKHHDTPPDWIEKHITYEMKTKEFVAWDETQANELGRSTSKRELISVCWRHAAKLAEERDND